MNGPRNIWIQMMLTNGIKNLIKDWRARKILTKTRLHPNISSLAHTKKKILTETQTFKEEVKEGNQERKRATHLLPMVA